MEDELLEPPPPEQPDGEQLSEALHVLGDMGKAVRGCIKHLPRRKSTGTNEISAELLQAAGEPGAQWIVSLFQEILRTGDVPAELRGGRLAKLFKGKGRNDVVDNYRGLLVSNHNTKVFTGVM